MEISIATNNAKAVETSTVDSILPDHYKNGAKELVTLIKTYYEYLNSKDSPSHELNNLIANHDIDLVDDNSLYLDAIERTVASIIPQSRVLDRKRLFKLISSYYNSRGSEESIFAFFRIFYNEIITLFYPKNFLFESSTEKSLISNKFRIRDSYKWQEFSYQIGATIPTLEWRTEYLKFVHPAGLKLFVALAVEMTNENNWVDSDLSFYLNAEEYNINDAWNLIDWKRFLGYHSPRMQPNVVGSENSLIALIVLMADGGKHYLEYIRPIYKEDTGFVDRDYLKAFYEAFAISYQAFNNKTTIQLFRDDWQISGKFKDFAELHEFGQMTIEEGDLAYAPGIRTQFNSFGVRFLLDYYIRSYEYEDPEDTDAVFIASKLDDFPQVTNSTFQPSYQYQAD